MQANAVSPPLPFPRAQVLDGVLADAAELAAAKARYSGLLTLDFLVRLQWLGLTCTFPGHCELGRRIDSRAWREKRPRTLLLHHPPTTPHPPTMHAIQQLEAHKTDDQPRLLLPWPQCTHRRSSWGITPSSISAAWMSAACAYETQAPALPATRLLACRWVPQL